MIRLESTGRHSGVIILLFPPHDRFLAIGEAQMLDREEIFLDATTPCWDPRTWASDLVYPQRPELGVR